MDFHVRSFEQNTSALGVSARCPACRNIGVLHSANNLPDIHFRSGDIDEPTIHGTKGYRAGVRLCPNFECKAVFFVVITGLKEHVIYPPEVIDFDSTGVPESIMNSFSEAIICESAGAYKACALMVRRTLEEICEDRGAKGANLKERLSELAGKTLVPKELIEAADELRLLGNDAAHLEAKTYDDIGKEEVGIAIEMAKELLKSVYQYADLVSRLKALKKKTS